VPDRLPYIGVRALRRQILFSGFLLPLAAEALVAQQVPEGRKPEPRARDVRLLIETDRTIYRVGDTIRVRVSMVNTSDQRILFYADGTETELIVRATDGQVVRPGGQQMPASTSGMPAQLLPHQTAPWGWREDDWQYLSDWGFQLRTPGRYTLRGLPRLSYPGLVPDHKTVRSNTVTITITP
jgi:hypothetical protein